MANKIYAEIANCLEKGIDLSSKEVQKLIKEHCDFASRFHQMSKNVYQYLAKLYSEHPE